MKATFGAQAYQIGGEKGASRLRLGNARAGVIQRGLYAGASDGSGDTQHFDAGKRFSVGSGHSLLRLTGSAGAQA